MTIKSDVAETILLKTCSKCKIEQPLNNFNKDKNTKDKLTYWCKLCYSNQNKAYSERRRLKDPAWASNKAKAWREKNPDAAKISSKLFRELNPDYYKTLYTKNMNYIKEIKAKTPCADCGKIYPTVCMEFDHIRGEKLDEVTALASSYPIEVIETEIAKCEVVCVNCHRLRTKSRSVLTDPPSSDEVARRARRAKIQAFIDSIKATTPCELCGGHYDPVCMDFDHKDRATKSATIAELKSTGCGKDRIVDEIAKCRLLCANCHRAWTSEQRGWK